MVRVRSGVMVVMLLGACAYASCSREPFDDDDEPDAGEAGQGTGFGGGGTGGSGNAGTGGDLGGVAGTNQGGRSGTAGADGGEDPGGTGGSNGGEDTGGTGGSSTGGAAGSGAIAGGGGKSGNAGAGASTGGNAGVGGASGGGSGGSGGGAGKGGSGGSGGGLTCGNRRVDAGESCDDGSNVSNDGCSAACLIEDGYDCQGAPSVCVRTSCGNMTPEPGEGCDDGNLVSFDGCSSNCLREPTCVTGMACTSPCGDGIVHGSEQCDDGNVRNGDGCSATCVLESGFVCDPEPCVMQNGVCTLQQPLVVRDFNRNAAAGGHPDFRPNYSNASPILGLVEPLLDQAGKPVLSSAATPTHGFLHGAQAFAQWYRNGAPASAPLPRTLVLWNDGAGGFVNRWGANGQRFAAYQNATFCSNTDCVACDAPPPGMVCRAPCPGWPGQACFVNEVLYDGNPLFFPIDSGPGLLADLRSEGKVPEQYGWPGWPWETAVAPGLGVTSPIPTSTAQFPSTTHNFDFTTEARLWFRYDQLITQRIAFTGDDDAWVFVNGRLAIDLGGWHQPAPGTATITAGAFSLQQGNLYEIAVFHAERQTEGSSYLLNVTGLTNPRIRCRAR